MSVSVSGCCARSVDRHRLPATPSFPVPQGLCALLLRLFLSFVCLLTLSVERGQVVGSARQFCAVWLAGEQHPPISQNMQSL